jgi:hypothetical protein
MSGLDEATYLGEEGDFEVKMAIRIGSPKGQP